MSGALGVLAGIEGSAWGGAAYSGLMMSPEVISRDPLLPLLPDELQLEVTGACNLRCRMCLVSYRPELSRSEGALSFETFRSLVDGNPRLRRVTLQGLGEPLLAPDLDRPR